MVKLTKKDQAALATFYTGGAFSTVKIVENLPIISQNLLKWIYEEIHGGVKLVEETFDHVIPAHTRKATTMVIGINMSGGPNTESTYTEDVAVAEEVRKRPYYELDWLRFSDGKAFVGLRVEPSDGLYRSEALCYIHRPFWARFGTDKKLALGCFSYRPDINPTSTFIPPDYPAVKLNKLTLVREEGDWAICKGY